MERKKLPLSVTSFIGGCLLAILLGGGFLLAALRYGPRGTRTTPASLQVPTLATASSRTPSIPSFTPSISPTLTPIVSITKTPAVFPTTSPTATEPEPTINTAEPLGTLGHGQIRDLNYSNDQTLVVVTTSGVYLYDAWTFTQRLAFDYSHVVKADLSLDGRFLAVGFDDGIVEVIDVEAKQQIGSYNSLLSSGKHDDWNDWNDIQISSLFFSPDSSTLVAVGGNIGGVPQISVIKLASRQLTNTTLDTLDSDNGLLETIAVSPDGATVAIQAFAVTGSSFGSQILILDTSSGEQIGQLDDDFTASSLAFSRDGNYLVTLGDALADSKAFLIVWDYLRGKQQHKVEIPYEAVFATTPIYSDNGYFYWYGKETGKVYSFNMMTDTFSSLPTNTKNPLYENVVFSPDAQRLLGITAEGDIVVEDLPSRNIVRTFSGSQSGSQTLADIAGQMGKIEGVAFDPVDNTTLWAITQSGFIYQWRNATYDLWETREVNLGVAAINRGVIAMFGNKRYAAFDAYSDDSWFLALLDLDNPQLKILKSTKLWERPMTGMAFSDDGEWLLVMNADHQENPPKVWVELWQTTTASLQQKIDLPTLKRGIFAPVISPDNRLTAGVVLYTGIYVWEMTNGDEVLFIPEPKTGSFCGTLAFSTQGYLAGCKEIFSATSMDVTQSIPVIWDLSEDNKYRKLSPIEEMITVLKFSLDGQILAGGGDNGSVIMWNASTGQVIAQWEGHDERITDLAFSPDGHVLASSDSNGTIMLWEVLQHAEWEH